MNNMMQERYDEENIKEKRKRIYIYIFLIIIYIKKCENLCA